MTPVGFLVEPPRGGDVPGRVNPPGRSGEFSAGTILMLLLIASLAIGFMTIFAAYAFFAITANSWPPPGTPTLPRTLWISTAILLVNSVFMILAIRAVRRDRKGQLQITLAISFLLALSFLGSQAWNLFRLAAFDEVSMRNKHIGIFQLLVVMHAAHLIGGLIPLAWVLVRSLMGRYTSRAYAGLRYCSMYWHFLDLVWLIMFAVFIAI